MSYKPPADVARAARRGLGQRALSSKSKKGGTSIGEGRARALAEPRAVSLETVKRMLTFFSRHLVDKQGRTWSEKGKGWQAWHLWGGDPGARWAAKIVRREDPAWFAQFLKGPRNRAMLRHVGASTRRVPNG